MSDGFYYLHSESKDLIFKSQHYPIEDARDSDFVRAIWFIDTSDRENAWNILVESIAIGADKDRVLSLALKWKCDSVDARVYADRVGCILTKDGDQYCATRKDFVNLQESPAGFGPTALEAMADLCKQLGYTGGKMNWHSTFKDLLMEKNEKS